MNVVVAYQFILGVVSSGQNVRHYFGKICKFQGRYKLKVWYSARGISCHVT